MTGFRNHRFTLASIGLTVGAALGTATLSGCPGGGGICGPCGTVINGDVGISGSAQLDGFFSAVASVGQITGSVQGEFEANIRALAEVWGFGEIEGEIDAAVVGELMAFIRAEIQGSVSGGISLEYVPPRCSANVSLAVEAQANCEASAGCECEVEVDPGEVSVSCEGTCSGGCSAECTGEAACNASATPGGISCMGSCEGSCALEAAASCEGTCNGQCDGECSARAEPGNAESDCQGSCSGMCTGTCELSAGGNCEGMCQGSCVAEPAMLEGSCDAELECRGSCSGECSGGCEGTARPPMASADCECEASADCNASASAQGEASIECTPPSLEFQFNFSAGLEGDLSAQAAFRARIGELRVRGAAILQGFAQMGAIINGRVNGELVFDPPPLVNIQQQFSGVIDAAASGEFEIAPGRIDCVVPALREAADVLASVATDTAGTIEAQASFSTELFAIAG